MSPHSDRRSIADRSSEVRQSILDLLHNTKTDEIPLETQGAEDILDRFKLWAGNLGAFHKPHKGMSLESRLADSPEVQGQICEQLDDMQEAMQDLLKLRSDRRVDLEPKPKSAQEHSVSIDLPADDFVHDTDNTDRKLEAASILGMVSECLKALFRIGILVRKATPRGRFERALQQTEFAFTAQFDIQYVEERYPKLASQDSRWLASRLGSANAKRRQFIKYFRNHGAKLRVEDIAPAADGATIAQSSKATTFVIPGNLSASEFLQSSIEREDDSVSLVSASTAFDNDTSLRLPSLTDLGPDGEFFECPICFTLQCFRKEKSWKIHAYRDLKAYVCTSGKQECEHKMFGDRDSWFNHELKDHHQMYFCKLCGCQQAAPRLLQQHILDDHGACSDEEIQSLIEHGKLVPSQLKAQDCPFCDDWASILSHRRHQTEGQTSSNIDEPDILVSLTHFKRHVATHQEQLAIFAVPRTVDDDELHSQGKIETNSETVSFKDDNLQISDTDAHPIEESASDELSPTCVRLSGLPPEVREADIENLFRLRELKEIKQVKVMKGYGFIDFEDPEVARRAVNSMDGVFFMDVPIKLQFARLSLDLETGKTHVAEDPPADVWDLGRAIDELTTLASTFPGDETMMPCWEEFIASPPSDPQEQQDRYNSIMAMTAQEQSLMGIALDTIDDQRFVASGEGVNEVVVDMPEQVRAAAILNRRDTEINHQGEYEWNSHQPRADSWRVKLYKLGERDWEDQGTGFCTIDVVETTDNGMKARIVVTSEEEPGRLMLEERVLDDDTFQPQQETLIVWIARQTGIDMALSFQEVTGRDAVWKILDTVQQSANERLFAPDIQSAAA